MFNEGYRSNSNSPVSKCGSNEVKIKDNWIYFLKTVKSLSLNAKSWNFSNFIVKPRVCSEEILILDILLVVANLNRWWAVCKLQAVVPFLFRLETAYEQD